MSVCEHACVCVCMYELRLVCMDKILHFTNTLNIIPSACIYFKAPLHIHPPTTPKQLKLHTNPQWPTLEWPIPSHTDGRDSQS